MVGSRKCDLYTRFSIDFSKKKSPVPQRWQRPVSPAERVTLVPSLKLERAEENFTLIFNHTYESPLNRNYTVLDKENKHLT